MMGRENEKLVELENRIGENFLASRLLTKVILGLFVMLGVILVFLIISNYAQASVDLNPNSQSDHGEPGNTINFNIDIQNQRNTPDIFYLSLEGTYKDWGEILDSTLQPISQIPLNASGQPGSFTNIIVSVTIPGEGETTGGKSYPIILKATSITTEGIEDQAQISITVDDYIDLQLDYSGSGPPKKDYDPNKKPPKFTFRLFNNGNQPEAGITVRVDPQNWAYTPETIGEELEPGGTATFSLEFTIPDDETEGEYELQVYLVSSVDPSEESDPVLIIVNITKPDLTVGNVNMPTEDELKGKVNDQVTISATVSNEGHAKAESIMVKLYVDDVSKATETISSIEPGGSRDVSFRWKVVAELVELKVKVIEIEEIDTGNNAIPPIYLDLRPDLKFEGEQIDFSNPNPEPGEKITIKALILNSGGDAEDVIVKFTYGTKTIGTDTLDIDYEEIGEATFKDWTVPDKPGEAIPIKVEIDFIDGKETYGGEATRYLNVAEEETVIGGVFSWTLLGIVIGFIAGAIIFFIVGFLVGTSNKSSQESRRLETAVGPSFVGFEPMIERPPEMEMRGEPYNLPPPPPPPPPPEIQEKSSPPSSLPPAPPQEGNTDFEKTEKEILGKEDELESNIVD